MSKSISATLRSTTGTAPIRFVANACGEPGLIYIHLEDGSGQVYRATELMDALGYVGAL